MWAQGEMVRDQEIRFGILASDSNLGLQVLG